MIGQPEIIIANELNWSKLSANPNAIHLIEYILYLKKHNYKKIDWEALSSNPKAIHLLERNLDKVDWYNLSINPNTIKLL